MTEPKEAEIVEPGIVDAEIVPSPTDVPPVLAPAPDYDEHGVPSFDFVRDRIEGRAATAIGTTELTGTTPEARTADEQFAAREEAGRRKLEELRRSLGG